MNYPLYLRDHPEIKATYRKIMWPPLLRTVIPFVAFFFQIFSYGGVLPTSKVSLALFAVLIAFFAYYPLKYLPKYAAALQSKASELQISLPPAKEPTFKESIKILQTLFKQLDSAPEKTSKAHHYNLSIYLITEALIIASTILVFAFPFAIFIHCILAIISIIFFDCAHQSYIYRLILKEFPPQAAQATITNYPRQNEIRSKSFQTPPSIATYQDSTTP